MPRAWSGAALVALLLAAGCGKERTDPTPNSKATPLTALDAEAARTDIVTVDADPAADPSLGATPMAQRVAVIGLLNKRNGATRDVTLKPGQAVRVGDVVIRLKACEQTAPWEQEHYTGAFVQLDVEGNGADNQRTWRRVFSGWLYKERPALNVVQHPIYDVWPKSCAMTFPLGGPDSVADGSAPDPAATPRSSAKKSAPDPEDSAPTSPDSADDSNTR